MLYVRRISAPAQPAAIIRLSLMYKPIRANSCVGNGTEHLRWAEDKDTNHRQRRLAEIGPLFDETLDMRRMGYHLANYVVCGEMEDGVTKNPNGGEHRGVPNLNRTGGKGMHSVGQTLCCYSSTEGANDISFTWKVSPIDLGGPSINRTSSLEEGPA